MKQPDADLSTGMGRIVVQATRTAADSAGASASLAVHLPPLYVQIGWFSAACGIALSALLYGAHRLRLRQVERNLREKLKARSQQREQGARDLHEALLQDTQALVLGFQAVADTMARDDPARAGMEAALDRADRILAQSRARVLELRTPESASVSLPEALSRVGEEMARIGQARDLRVVVEGCAVALATPVRDECYRIGREAILDAFRRAEAKSVEVQIIYAPTVFSMHIRDDGRGMDQATLLAGQNVGHAGLLGMRTRAIGVGGRLEVWSGPGPGTEIRVEIPGAVAYRTSRRRAGPT